MKIWDLGNEVDGKPWELGHKNAEDYIEVAREAAKAMTAVDKDIEFVGCGSSWYSSPDGWDNWNRKILTGIGDKIKYLSIHSYWESSPDYYTNMGDGAKIFDDRIKITAGEIEAVSNTQGYKNPIYLSVDEWGAFGRNFMSILPVAQSFNSFIRHADVVKMGNFTMLTSLLSSDPKKGTFKSPVFYTFKLFSNNCRGTSADTYVACDIELPDPGPTQVVVRQFASGVCHSQLHQMHRPRQSPVILGHESTGVVEKVRLEGTPRREGDLVLVTWVPRDASRAKALPVRATLNVSDGMAQSENVFTWANFTLADEQYVVKVDPRTPRDVTSIIGCAVMTGAGAVINTASVRRGQSVAIFGVGGVGLSAVVGARMAGANPIIAVDLDDTKLEFAERFGATHMINAAKVDPIEAIHALTPRKHEFTILQSPGVGRRLRVRLHRHQEDHGADRAGVPWRPLRRSRRRHRGAGRCTGHAGRIECARYADHREEVHRQHWRIVRAGPGFPEVPRLAQERRSRSGCDRHAALPHRRHQRSH